MLEHKDRIRSALALANKTAGQLQKELGISPAAMKYLLDGDTKSFTAANNARAARFLEVDAFWLAPGEGQPRPERGWPFTAFLPSQYFALEQSLRDEVEDRLAGAIMRQDRANGTGP